jgi:hypothetical protein
MVNREQDGTSALDRYLLIIGETLEKGENAPGFGISPRGWRYPSLR